MLRLLYVFAIILTCSGFLYGQDLKGFIFNESHQPLPSAHILCEKTRDGTISNQDGFFIIKRNNKYKKIDLKVSCVGYITKTVTISSDEDNITVILEKDLIPVKEVVVEARQNRDFESIVVPVRIRQIDTIELKAIPAVSAVKLFNHISGVNISSEFGVFSSSSSVSLRGIGGSSQNGTLVLLDGTPVNKSDAGSVNWNIIDRDQIEKIEILKGPGSALHGTNAMGGIINIITQRPKEKLSVTCSAAYGTFNTAEGKTSMSGRLANGLLYWKWFGHIKTSDGYINTPDEVIKENDTVVVPVYLDEKYTGGMFGIQINEKQSAEVSLNYFNDIRGRGIKIYEYEGSNVERNTWHSFLKYKSEFRKTRVFANLFMLYEDYFRLNEYFSDGEYNLYEVASVRNDYGAKIWAEWTPRPSHQLTWGADIKTGIVDGADIYYTTSDVIRNTGKMDIYSAFVQHRIQLRASRFSLVTGIRCDMARFHNAAFSIENPSYSVEYMVDFVFDHVPDKMWTSFSPKIALEYTFSPRLKNYLSAGKGFRAPILDELCRNEERRMGFRKANPGINPEYIYNFEYGFDAEIIRDFTLSSSLFYSAGNDFMYLMNTGDSVNLGYTWAPIYVIDNISRVNIYGAEADMTYRYKKKLTVFANYSWNIGTIASIDANALSNKDLTGKYLVDIPEHKYSAGFSFFHKWVNVSYTLKYTGKRWIRDDNEVDQIYLLTDKYPAYYMMDMRMWRKMGSFELSCEADNLGNVIYINSRGYKSHGRFFLIRLLYQFNLKK
jgi:iron complex outermembrane receptor protein